MIHFIGHVGALRHRVLHPQVRVSRRLDPEPRRRDRRDGEGAGWRCSTSRTCAATTRSRSTPGPSASTATGSDPARSTRSASTSASAASGACTSRLRRDVPLADGPHAPVPDRVQQGQRLEPSYPMTPRRSCTSARTARVQAAAERAEPTRWLSRAAASARCGGGAGRCARQGDVEPVPRPRDGRAARASTSRASTTCSRSIRSAGWVDAEGMTPYEDAGRRDCLRARRDARGGAAAKTITLGGAVGRRRHRGVVVPLRPGARHGARARGAARRRQRRDLHARQRAPRPVLRLSRTPTARSATRCGVKAQTIPVKPLRAARRTPPLRRGAHTSASSSAPATRATPTSSTARCSRRTRCSSPSAASSTRRPTPATTPSSTSTTARSASATTDYLTTHDYHLALGHRLVLVLEERLRAESAGAQALRHASGSDSRTYTQDHALEQPRGLTEKLERAARACTGVGDPGRRHPDRARRRVPRVLCARDRHRGRCGSARSRAGADATRFALYPMSRELAT